MAAGLVDEGRFVLLGSAKWSRLVGPRVLDQLLAARDFMGPRAAHARLVLFGRHGFSPELQDRAEREEVTLIDGEKLFA